MSQPEQKSQLSEDAKPSDNTNIAQNSTSNDQSQVDKLNEQRNKTFEYWRDNLSHTTT
jgi:hypothetical protein